MRTQRRPRTLALGTLGAIATLKLILHLAAIGRYGYFRDELYYLASTEHLSWGYVDHPPFSIALLAVVRALFGDSLIAVRIVPALAGVATVWLTGVIAWQLGGGRFAQGLAALAALFSPVFLGIDHFYSMNALELLFWTAGASLVLVALESGRTRDWVWLGVLLGLGLLNKISMSWFAAGLVVGLLLTPYRRVFRERGIWVAGVVAGLVFFPHVIWQIRHGWPTLEFMRNATSQKMASVSPLSFLIEQILTNNPGAFLIWLGGLVYGLVRAGPRARVLVWIYLTVFGLLVFGGHSRASYLAPAYPMVFALGGIAVERVSLSYRWLRPASAASVVIFGLVALPMALPLLPVETFVRYQAALHQTPRTDERQEVGALPQHYADMFGWDDMVALVARAYAELTPEEKQHARVFGQNYGEAGAVDVLGRRLGLPHAMSGHNSYWLWGPGSEPVNVVIIIGGDREDNAQFFEDITIVGQTSSPWSMPYERGLDVSIARKPKMDLRQAWTRVKEFI
jgi:dolichyl-phosphate-mannose-protein mannosyltransferase